MQPRRTVRRPLARRLAPLLALLLCLAALPARAEFWEAPVALADGRFPSFFATQAGPLLIWQDSQPTGETGKAWIRFARFEDGVWKNGNVSESSYPYTSAGAPPILYSASQAKSGTVAVAIAASGTSIEVRQLREGTRSFEAAGSIEASTTSVAPRIFPSASGGWLVFVTQGKPSQVGGAANQPAADASQLAANQPAPDAAQAGADATGAAILQSSVSIYVARSGEGRSWSSFQPLVADSEALPMNFAPSASALGAKDIVVFQTFVLGEGNLSSRYALMSKSSDDGGATWTLAKNLTGFRDPSGGADAAPENYDNQGAQLTLSGGKLYIAWERHKAKSTQTQVWSARIDETGSLDPKSAGPATASSSSFMLSQLLDSGSGPELLAREDKLKANRILLATPKASVWSSEDTDLSGRSDSSGAGLVAFARLVESGGRKFMAWQIDQRDGSHIFAMVPDVHADAPSLSPLNFTVGTRTRAESALVRVNLPKDASGFKDFVYLWKKLPDKGSAVSVAAPSLAELWKSGEKHSPDQPNLSLPAGQDGPWQLWASAEDNAGNRSPLASLPFYRKRIPPAPPIVMSPETDENGFLPTNSFSVQWIPPEGDDIAGYTWDLAYAAPLEGALQVPAALKRGAAAPGSGLPGFSAYESSLLAALGLRLPPPGVRGTAPGFSATNVDNGYYVFSVSAIDTTGNISGVSSILLKADKYKPYTEVTLAESSHDDLGRSILRILGKGFLADGQITRVVLSRNGREPYDIEGELAKGEYRIVSDRELSGLTFEDAAAGSYRIGLYHSTRGWYWTSPLLAIDTAGTVKYGVTASYEPSFRLFSGLKHPFTIYDAIVLMAIAFAASGILLSSRQVIAVVREGEVVRLEALALVTGGPMPQAATTKAARALKRRRTSLRVKFTLIIAILVIFVVLLLAISLGYNMSRARARTWPRDSTRGRGSSSRASSRADASS
jgi:hypothetical protein